MYEKNKNKYKYTGICNVTIKNQNKLTFISQKK